MGNEVLEQRMRQVLHDEKWKIFLRRSRPWRHIPFVELVLAAGSMATGNVHENSDFDVIVGARRGRIFTARFFSILAFGALGWRRQKLSHREEAKDRVCLNHFVTEAAYALQRPHHAYWKNLYQNLVPLYGSVGRVNDFVMANAEWMEGARVYRDDLRHRARTPSVIKRGLEQLLFGRFGDLLERFLKRMQVARIRRSLSHDPPGYRPRIRVGDDELEFHPDTKRIEQYSQTR